MAVSHGKSLTPTDFTGTITGFNSQGSTKTIAATDLVRPVDWNSGHNQFYTLSGNSSGSNLSGTNIVIAGGDNIRVSGSTAAGAGTLWISKIDRTLSNIILGRERDLPYILPDSFSMGQNSLYLLPFSVEEAVTGEHLRFQVAITNSSLASSSGQKGQTMRVAVYTRNDTNATLLTRHYSTSWTIAVSYSSNVSWMISYITGIGNSTSYSTTSTSSAGVGVSSLLHGARDIVVPWSTMLTPGEYWLGIHNSTSGAGSNAQVLSMRHIGNTWLTANRLGIANASSSGAGYAQIGGLGVYSTTTGAIPDAISQTQIWNAGSAPTVYFATGTV